MNRIGISHATLMLLVCALPLVVFFALVLIGVQFNPLWMPVIMVLCCLAMPFLVAGCCDLEHKPNRTGRVPPSESGRFDTHEPPLPNG